VLFRRLVHVVSTVSVAQQYHFYKRDHPTAEHTSSQRTIEYQDLPLEHPLLNTERSFAISHVLAEQWSRLKGRNFLESWRSSLMAQQQQNLSVYPSHSRLSFPLFYYRYNWVAAMVRANETTFDRFRLAHPSQSNPACVPHRNSGTPAIRSGIRPSDAPTVGRTEPRYHPEIDVKSHPL
jgi:hypothetical protein